MDNKKKKAILMKKILNLNTYPVGVKFYFNLHDGLNNTKKLNGYRYCQALMEARHGGHVILNADGISCPAAAAAFGFKPLTDVLKTGKGLKGFGIVKDEKTGVEMFSGMTVLEQNKLKELYLFPLEEAKVLPDIVIVEDEVEKIMWIVLAEINRRKGERIESSTAVLQATCVDTTIIPFVHKKLNMSFGCYGCRDATDIGPNEAVLGFPFEFFDDVISNLEFLSQKAIPFSRNKNAYIVLKEKFAEKAEKKDPFLK